MRRGKSASILISSDDILWMRAGDSGEYENFGSDLSAVVSALSDLQITEIDHWISGGFHGDNGFRGKNYVSLFWGDSDANFSSNLDNSDKKQLEKMLKLNFAKGLKLSSEHEKIASKLVSAGLEVERVYSKAEYDYYSVKDNSKVVGYIEKWNDNKGEQNPWKAYEANTKGQAGALIGSFYSKDGGKDAAVKAIQEKI